MYTMKRTPEFEDWLINLKDGMTRIRLARRLEKAQRGLLGDIAHVGEGVSEMREFFARVGACTTQSAMACSSSCSEVATSPHSLMTLPEPLQ